MPRFKRTSVFILAVAVLLSIGPAFAGPRGKRLPLRYAPGSMDQAPVLATNPVDGTVWSAWAWRESGEYSIAVSVQTDGVWSEPVLIGRDNRTNEVAPALVFDDQGVAYLAWAVRPGNQVLLTAIPGPPESYLEPRVVSRKEVSSGMPSLAVVGNRLVVAFRAGRQVVIRDLPLYRPPQFGSLGIQEGPDSVDPLGWHWGTNGDEPDEDESGETWNDESGDNNTSSNTRPFTTN